MSFGIGGMGGGVSQFNPPKPEAYSRGPGEGIKGSPIFKFADAIVKTVATYYTMGGTAGMAMSAWKKALTTGDTSQGELYKSSGGGGGPKSMGSTFGREALDYGLTKGKTWLENKLQELAKAEQASKIGGAGPQGTAMLNQLASGAGPGSANPYTGTWEKDLAQWKQDFGLESPGTSYDSTNPWASLMGMEPSSSGFDSGGYGADNMDWANMIGGYGDYGAGAGAGDWFNSGAGYGIDNMDWTSAVSDFSDYTDLFSSFGGA